MKISLIVSIFLSCFFMPKIGMAQVSIYGDALYHSHIFNSKYIMKKSGEYGFRLGFVYGTKGNIKYDLGVSYLN